MRTVYSLLLAAVSVAGAVAAWHGHPAGLLVTAATLPLHVANLRATTRKENRS
ncbi:hypothetical protein Lfu02_32540 [Longispora fulva]|uniref:Uncharacterized protein n=1 Tax=Longispora fulva TaxID=619741 RepID=A0A8J7GTS9_9ACTN|nr:hypothetical protein [Longispora fulva]MBG6139385.1 hypothetical protein [Longispora fulva]GIG58882.1 hypothetical protein Lfu02_32540 [Longispora fulva]